MNDNTERVIPSKTYLLFYPSSNGHAGHLSEAIGVHLACAPASNVTLTATPTTGITATPSTLTFTPANYLTNQSVTISGRTYGSVRLAAPGYVSADVDVEYDPCVTC